MIKGFVHIVESPSSEDLLKGETEGRVLSEAFSLTKIPMWYNLVTNKQTLGQTLGQQLITAWNYWKQPPVVLHMSMHGNKSGVELTSNEYISWDELRQYLLPLIHATNGSLLITMSSCFGIFGAQMAMYEDNEPTYWALVGNTNALPLSDLAIAYSSFYHLLFFKSQPIQKCVDSMKVASGNPNFILSYGQNQKAQWIASMNQQRLQEYRKLLEQGIHQTGVNQTNLYNQ